MSRIRLRDRVHAPRLVFMDCDGVIFDANRAKARAYRASVAGHPEEAIEALVAHHQAHGGISRYVKLRRFFTELSPVEDVEAALQVALTRFSEVAKAEYEALEPAPEALALADRFGADEVYVVSGADEEELRGIFEKKGILGRFAAVHGSPETKRAHVARILAARDVPAAEALFIGDGRGDLETAEALSIPFVFLEQMSDWHERTGPLAAARDATVVPSWAELLARIEP